MRAVIESELQTRVRDDGSAQVVRARPLSRFGNREHRSEQDNDVTISGTSFGRSAGQVMSRLAGRS
jgi:hypothetical protein